MQKLEPHTSESCPETKISLHDFSTKIENLKLSELEDEFRVCTEAARKNLDII